MTISKLDKLNKLKVNVISLGCSKNLVDSELILGRLGEKGCILVSSPKFADIIIINTCSFIKDARKESYDVIAREAKEKSAYQKLIVCGCLPQLEKRKLFYRFPEIDALLGSSDFYRIDEAVEKILQGERVFLVSTPKFIYNSGFSRLVSTPPGYAYLKIAEGCSNCCSYCLIPYLRGDFRSREVEDVVKEAKSLAKMGVKELILIAQDITYYGQDRGKSGELLRLLEKLEKIKGISWIRLLYLHPGHFDVGLIRFMRDSDKVCRYVDIPLQHTHDEILKMMNRPPFKVAQTLIEKIREAVPDVTLRTTFMVGFPGEKAYHFEKLMKDVENLEFDWLGVFTYSREKNTPAYFLPEQVHKKIKEKRKNELLLLQRAITLKKNKEKVGKIFPVIIDLTNSDSEWGEGHTPFQTPEIDGKTLFIAKRFTPGQIFRGKVTSVKDFYDLYIQIESE